MIDEVEFHIFLFAVKPYRNREHIHGMMEGMIRKSGFELLAYMYTHIVSSPSFKMMIQTKDGNKKYHIMIDGSSDIIEE